MQQPAPLTAPPSRGTRAASWIAWHAGELAAVGIPAGLALTVSGWIWLVAAVTAGTWAVHEARQIRQRNALLASSMRPAVTASDDEDNDDSVDAEASDEPVASENEVRHA